MDDKRYIKKLYKKFTENTITEEELKLLWQYLNKATDEDLQPLKAILRNKSSVGSGVAGAKNREKMWERLEARAAKDSGNVAPTVRLKNSGSYTWYKVAAVLALIIVSSLGFYLFFYTPQAPVTLLVHQTGSRQKATVTLSDGSKVRLNAQSKLEYPEIFDGSNRAVRLEGEAFFEVVPNANAPFIVRSGDVTTTVLGTSFNIRAYPEDADVEVAVATGKVAVAAQTGEDESPGQKLFLVPNEVANYHVEGGNLRKEARDIGDLIAWKDGVLILNDKNYTEIAKILEQWYGTKITIAAGQLKGCSYRGTFQNPNLRKVLEALKFAHGISYEFTDGGVIIRGNGCK